MINSHSQKSATSNSGMVASVCPRAASAGIRVLETGGNAFDAAVAVAGVEWLTNPSNCGLGGDTFAILYDATRDRMTAINGSGCAGTHARAELYVEQGFHQMPLTGWHASAIPGTPDACVTLNREFGTRSLRDLLAPAIECAEHGVIVSPSMKREIDQSADKLREFQFTSAFLPGGMPPKEGMRLPLTDLGRSIRKLAEEGSEPFHTGHIAKEMVRASEAAYGPFTSADFSGHQTEVYQPISTTYRGIEVFETAPPSQGLIVLEWLNLLEGDDLRAMGFESAATIHLLIETKKLAFADRVAHCGVTRSTPKVVDILLSKDYAKKRRQSVDLGRAVAIMPPGTLPEKNGDTSYFAIVDAQGNAISFIHSLSAGFGCGVIAGNTGIVMNNRAGRGFSLEKDHPNQIAPGKKTMHTLNCYMLCHNNRPWLVGGTPGGDRQVQWNVQAITNFIDHGMGVDQIVDAPSWISWPGGDPADINAPFELHMETRFSNTTTDTLKQYGHALKAVGNYGIGSRHQLISIDEAGIMRGATDPRVPGVAIGI